MGRLLPVLLCALLACDAGRSTAPRAPEPRPAAPAPKPAPPAEAPPPGDGEPDPAAFQPPDVRGWGKAAGLEFLEVVKGGAKPDDRLPLVIMIHGLGDRPRDVWVQEVGVPMRVVMPQAPKPHHSGYSWFSYRVGDNDPQALAIGVAQAAQQLARAIEAIAQHRPTAGRPIVGGFSQGGMLTYALSVLHPQVVGTAFPMSGMLPRPLWPANRSTDVQHPPIGAIHGDVDTIVPVAPARALIEHLRGLGYEVELQEYPGVAHAISPEMGAALGDRIDRAAKAAAGQ